MTLELALGVKSDPIEYRYSHPWLFQLLADEGISLVQIGSHFEMYQLPDEFFLQLREQAEEHGIQLASMFTAHRELGGFFRDEPGYEQVARRNFERKIEIGGLLGATSVGSNPGAVLRDRMELKSQGIECYLKHMMELMHFAHEKGVEWLTIEPMSCLAEPPTLPDEVAYMGSTLREYHERHAESTAQVGYCTDIAHGYADENGAIVHTPMELFEPTLPYLYEVHLKNTDSKFNSTFGFSPDDLGKGIIDVSVFRDRVLAAADQIPTDRLVGYLEIGGPKLGRDYSDHLLAQQLQDSLHHLKAAWLHGLDHTDSEKATISINGNGSGSRTGRVSIGMGVETGDAVEISNESYSSEPSPTAAVPSSDEVVIAPSMMCVDQLNFESALHQVEALGVGMLHMDIMDGRFVPNMPMGLGMLTELAKRTSLPIDVHLMVDDNDFFVQQLAGLGIYQISVHAESSIHLDRTLGMIREMGVRAGVALNPATSLSTLEYIHERLDHVLIMTVNPGYAGQKLTPASIRKIRDCRAWLDQRGLEIPIQVDGNVSFENIPHMVAAGANQLVAGTSSIFHRDNSWSVNMEAMLEAIAQGTALAR